MTLHGTEITARPPVATRIRGALSRILDVVEQTSRCTAGGREAERLLARSDGELARMGLRRDEVFRHAFSGYLHP